MTTALLCSARKMVSPIISTDLLAVGIVVSANVDDCSKLVHAVALHAPDVVICNVLVTMWLPAAKNYSRCLTACLPNTNPAYKCCWSSAVARLHFQFAPFWCCAAAYGTNIALAGAWLLT